MEPPLKAWLDLARTAPSAHNTQPWQCRPRENSVEIAIDRGHALHGGDPTQRQTILGIGAFLETLLVAAAADGWEGTPQYAFEPTEVPLVTVTFSKKGAASDPDKKLGEAILQRHTNRGLYHPEPLSEEILHDLAEANLPAGVEHTLISDERREKLAKLAETGIRIGLSMQPLKEELADLVFYQKDQASTGMLVEAMTEAPSSYPSGREWLLNGLDVEKEAAFTFRKFSTAPVIVLISSEQESIADWLKAGQALQRLLLTAASHDLTHCITAAPVEIPPLIPQVRSLSGLKGRPQAMVRFGRPQNPAFTIPSPRRELQEILTP